MTILQILILAVCAALINLLPRGRTLAIVGVSTLALYWLASPSLAFPSLPFWLQTLTLFITVLVWIITTPAETRRLRDHWPALITLAGAAIVASLTRELPAPLLTIPTPGLISVAGALVVFALIALGVNLLRGSNRLLMALGILTLLAIFILLKSPSLTQQVFGFLSALRGRELEVDPSKPLIIAWLGYSYVAFRLIHIIRDRQTGLLPAVSLDEFICYIIFFPSIAAGPIDRVERFVQDLRAPLPLKNDDWLFAGQRLVVGLFKKFVIADWLAWLSISDALVGQTRSGAWLWFFLYAYTFRIYFDFGGYTDIAIGMARLMGVRLPENFAAPFLKPNLTQFWNSWHITLTQWFRSYFFNPLARLMRTSKRPLPFWLILLLAQIATMGLIGLWHGITWNFLLWGLWNGIGLFLQSRWSEFVRVRFPNLGASPFARRALTVTGVILTFHFFALSLLFFSLSQPQISISALMKLFGIS